MQRAIIGAVTTGVVTCALVLFSPPQVTAQVTSKRCCEDPTMACVTDSATCHCGCDDHLKCYRVIDPVHPHGLGNANWLDLNGAQFGLEHCRIVSTYRLFCVPVRKAIVGPVFNGNQGSITPIPLPSTQELTQDQLCYRIRCNPPNPPAPTITDQFGTRKISNLSPFLLCGPAVKVTTTTTTSSSSTTTTLCSNSCSPCVGGVPNGIIEVSECCDDGNIIDCDACHNDCSPNTGCGDCHCCPPEQCDPPGCTCPPGMTCDATCMCH